MKAETTALHPLQWCLGMLLTALVAAGAKGCPEWILYSLAGGIVVVLMVTLGAYFFLLFTDRDSLRAVKQKTRPTHGEGKAGL